MATLLLIVIAVTIISVTYAWIMTYTDNTTDKTGVMLYEVNTSFASTPAGTITLDIGNSGISTAKIVAVYIGCGSDSNMTLYTPTYNSPSTADISQNGISSFNVTITGGWTSGQIYYFKVVSESGNLLAFNKQAP